MLLFYHDMKRKKEKLITFKNTLFQDLGYNLNDFIRQPVSFDQKIFIFELKY